MIIVYLNRNNFYESEMIMDEFFDDRNVTFVRLSKLPDRIAYLPAIEIEGEIVAQGKVAVLNWIQLNYRVSN